MSAGTIVRPKPGEVLVINGDPVMLWSRCGRLLSTLACVTCTQTLANQGQLEMHIEADGDHVLAVWCEKHGWEAPPREDPQ